MLPLKKVSPQPVMTQAIAKPKLTFEEYLSYDDGTDNRYELVDGELVALPPESGRNAWIAKYLFLVLSRLVGFELVNFYNCEVQVPVLKPGYAANRYPDLVILRPEHIELTRTRMTVTLNMPPPDLVVEVVSPGKVNRERDYTAKREQYAARGIPEYWIADPDDQVFIVLQLKAGVYVEVGRFQGSERIVSPGFPELELTAEQVLNPSV